MQDQSQLIHLVDLSKINIHTFKRRAIGCIVVSQDHKIILQQRDDDCHTYPGCLATFGGGIEHDETPLQTLVRELKEELGAEVGVTEVIDLGAITEASTQHTELIYTYFWQDKKGSITGCYEGAAIYYDNIAAALQHPKIMDDVRWLLATCQKRKLLA